MLWVKSQNNKSLLNVKKVTVKGKYIEGVVGRSFFTEWSKQLGKYESHERALEILQDIQSHIESNYSIFTMPEK
ncbi:hypothetical protein [Alkalibacillus haloalkaliphilus]|uniref:hypothetical protein n=1 Tax=Alkalibacillus haloalkaliphilus TaxID=94136 RepID=UPI002935FA64|nr:hypothetical protein [Alkalibacillus haloalkaliphilus]MDV2582414.1 hypothetical protein [Alkalibacillus haloalkaliphilus]